MCDQFNENLDNGENTESGIDVNMMIFFILVVGAQVNGAVGNQRAVLFTGEQNRDGALLFGSLENRQVPQGVPVGSDNKEHRFAAEPVHKPVEKPLPVDQNGRVIQGVQYGLQIFGSQ